VSDDTPDMDEKGGQEPGADPTVDADGEAPESLEERLERLERIMGRLEADDVPLEEALRLFEEGVGHVRAAEKILAETELKVEELLSDGTTEAFEEGAGG